MGRDNHPKERQQKQLERKLDRRASYDRILIVSEGSKTEPNYFSEIRATYRLNTANVEVQPGQHGTAPIQVVQYAKDLFEQGDRHKNIQPRAFERVYAVLDRDDVMRRLKQYIPTYEKGASNVFANTRASLVVAIQRSEALALKFTADSAPEPYTGIAEVVKLLTALRV